MPTNWDENMHIVWRFRKDLRKAVKLLKAPIKEQDYAAVRNQIAWIKATCEGMLCACNDFESEGP